MQRLFVFFLFVLFLSCRTKETVIEKDVFILHSPLIQDDFTISFRTADQFDKSKPFTLIFIADGSLGMGKYVLGKDSMEHAKLPGNTILIAIGHTGSTDTKRRRDFIPSETGGQKNNNFGNADQFYSFLTSDIIPFVEKKFPGAKQKVFIGHSFSGLFSLYLALKNDGLFDKYFAISPSVWANHHELLKIEEVFAKNNSDLATSIHIYAGGLEFLNKVLFSSEKFYKTVKDRKFKNLKISFDVISGVNHFSIRKPAINKIMASLGD